METLRFAHQFFHFFDSSRSLWEGRVPSWRQVEALFDDSALPRRSLGFGEVRGFRAARDLFETISKEEAELGIRVLCPENDEYPAAILENIPPERRPALLYVRGRDLPPEEDSVAVVGTRSPSACGTESAHNFSSYFSGLGLHIISGLARGVDSIAHAENLPVGTVAVLGGGVGKVYPKENQLLAEAILTHQGTLVSQFPLYQVPLPQNFPTRNELIAALSCGTVVIEGAELSGAAITGKHALAMGKATVALSQDFRACFGRGAVRLQQAGAVFVANEEEALQAIYSRVGGFARGDVLECAFGRRKRLFGFNDFQNALGKNFAEAATLLEEAILRGRIERIGTNRYRLLSAKGVDA
jgi:DNA protecting protein DprA